jgi:hypothetical protein
VDGCFEFVRAAAALLESGFAILDTRTTEREPTEVGRGQHNGSYYYEGAVREGDAERFVTLETHYNQPEEMMYPETHTWLWVYTVRGLSDDRALVLRCHREALTGDTTGGWAALEVTGSVDECAAVLALFRERFAKGVTAP